MCGTICPGKKLLNDQWTDTDISEGLQVSSEVHSVYMAKPPFFFSLQSRSSQTEVIPFGEEEILYGPASTCFWVWM